MYYKCMFSSSSKINSLDEENLNLEPIPPVMVRFVKEMALFVQMFL